MKIKDLFEAKELPSNYHPNIGWWLDSDPVTFYHGTHTNNLQGVLENGLYAPKEGPTANWISLALDPVTARGYASMGGGETSFRKAGGKAVHIPKEQRIVFVIQLPQSYFLPKMADARGHMDVQRSKLKDKNLFLQFKEEHPNYPDTKYYELTEIRLPGHISPKFIVGWMKN